MVSRRGGVCLLRCAQKTCTNHSWSAHVTLFVLLAQSYITLVRTTLRLWFFPYCLESLVFVYTALLHCTSTAGWSLLLCCSRSCLCHIGLFSQRLVKLKSLLSPIVTWPLSHLSFLTLGGNYPAMVVDGSGPSLQCSVSRSWGGLGNFKLLKYVNTPLGSPCPLNLS